MQAQILAGPHGFTVFWSICFIIIGIVFVTHHIPNDGCVGETVSAKEHQDVTLWAKITGWTSLAAGIIGIFGGFLGCCGGIHQYHRMYANAGPKRQKRCIVCSSILVFLAIVLTVIVFCCIGLAYIKSKDICDTAMCYTAPGGHNLCGMGCEKNVVTEAIKCTTDYCPADHAAFCDNKPISLAGLVIIGLTDLCFLVALCFSCGAGCCCPAKFELAVAAPAPKVDPEAQNKAES